MEVRAKDMKYIRTKDGIYEVSNTYIDDWHNKSYKVVGGGSREYCERYDEIVKEADTIEELCDWFAFEDTFDAEHFGVTFLFNSASLARLYAVEKKRKTFGYLVIEKNGVKTLEPVLQTNEKGEFELP